MAGRPDALTMLFAGVHDEGDVPSAMKEAIPV
jgi:hypothetical protein